jgi:hypothetical protein
MKASFEEMVEDLSTKYHVRHSRVYDLMTLEEVRLILHKPLKYIFNYEQHRTDAYNVINKYLGIQKVHAEKRFGVR